VLHFQASMERLQKKSNTTDQILIVCHMGVGMSRLLQVKLEQQYKGIQIMDCIGKMELPTFLKTHTPDLIVSTVELDHIDIPYVKISPLLEERDKAKLNHFFQECEKEMKQQEGSLQTLLEVENIHVQVRLEHRFEVVEMLGNALLQKKKVKQDFV